MGFNSAFKVLIIVKEMLLFKILIFYHSRGSVGTVVMVAELLDRFFLYLPLHGGL